MYQEISISPIMRCTVVLLYCHMHREWNCNAKFYMVSKFLVKWDYNYVIIESITLDDVITNGIIAELQEKISQLEQKMEKLESKLLWTPLTFPAAITYLWCLNFFCTLLQILDAHLLLAVLVPTRPKSSTILPSSTTMWNLTFVMPTVLPQVNVPTVRLLCTIQEVGTTLSPLLKGWVGRVHSCWYETPHFSVHNWDWWNTWNRILMILNGSYICSKHKQELSSFHQFIVDCTICVV